MLRLKRATVARRRAADAMEQRLSIQIDGERRSAIADVGLVGAAQAGDELDRQRRGGRARARLGRLRRRPRQPHARPRRRGHAARARHEAQLHEPAARGRARSRRATPTRRPTRRACRSAARSAVLALHGQLAPLAWAFAQARPGRAPRLRPDRGRRAARRALVRRARAARRRPARRPPHRRPGVRRRRRRGDHDRRRAAPRPRRRSAGTPPSPVPARASSARARRSATAACRRWTPRTPRSRSAARRCSSRGCPRRDLRARHRGLSHHTRTVLDLLLAPVTVAVPAGEALRRRRRGVATTLARAPRPTSTATCATSLPSRSMGREDPLFFAAALAAGTVLAEMAATRHERPRAHRAARRRDGLRGLAVHRPRRALPPRRRRGRRARDRPPHGRRRRSSPTTTSTSGSCASRARRSASYTLELPAGKLDVEGESPLQTAQRELAEEIGREAERLGGDHSPITPSIGYTDERVHLFAATGLRDADVEADPGERIEIVPWPLDDLDGAIAETTDAKTLIGLQWLREQRLSSGATSGERASAWRGT